MSGNHLHEMTGGPAELRADEYEQFVTLDRAVVRLRDEVQGLDFAQRLRRIHDGELWRGGWPEREAAKPTWTAYVRERAGLTKRRADQLVAWARMCEEWEPGFPPPPTERHARPLTSLSTEQRGAAVELLGGSFDGATGEDVREAADRVAGRRALAVQPEATVQVKGRGPVPVSKTRIAQDLAAAHAALTRIANKGPYAIPDFIAAASPDRRRRITEQVETSARVLQRFYHALNETHDPNDGPAQERMLLVA